MNEDFEEKSPEIIKILCNLLFIQIKIFSNSLSDSRFLTKISKIVSIENKFIIIDRNLLYSILDVDKFKDFDLSSQDLTIEFLVYQILQQNHKLQAIMFEIDDKEFFSRSDPDFNSEILLKYKVIDLEINLNTKHRKTLIDLGFELEKTFYWAGYFDKVPKKLLNLKGTENIFNSNIFSDNPRTIIKFNKKFLPKFNKEVKLLQCL